MLRLFTRVLCGMTILCPKIQTGFAFKPHMNDVYVEAFNNQTSNQNGDESAILRMKYYNPRDLIFEHLPVKKSLKYQSQ